MSDHWEYYPCQIEDKTAFIFYDHGINDIIDNIEVNQFVWIKMNLKTDNGYGLPNDEEFIVLNQIDDDIEEFAQQNSGVYVGRVTVNAVRYFHAYVDLDRCEIENIIKNIIEKYGYMLEYSIEDDPEKLRYWDDLFPTEEDWRVLNDLKVIERLELEGDNCEIPRRVDHWIYFKDSESAEEFQKWAQTKGFGIHSLECVENNDNDKKFILQIFISERPIIEDVTETSINLINKAKELDGEYDGWETAVEKDVTV